MNTPAAAWTHADLVCIDLEGTGPQDPAGEAMLEIALVPLIHGEPAIAQAYSTLVNPGRPIPRGPWISPGITNPVLATAPSLAEVAPTIASRVAGKILVGHNVAVDWRLLHQLVPEAAPVELLDTLRLARALHPERKSGHGLASWLERLILTPRVDELVPGSQHHRALWDATAAGLLLAALLADQPHDLASLRTLAGIRLTPAPEPMEQPSLWD
ncbi:3'-5' exonuclease [Sciscionella marina]|uniref:3'-5' exonuclease n=1 Tax=Sciscionella marina TaxID=508770 RepID=UPI0004766E29|nr:3'-5' exonuclease [Sciscionella marina]